MYLRSLTQLRRVRSRIFVTLTFSYQPPPSPPPPAKEKKNTGEKEKGRKKEKDTRPLLSDFHFDTTFSPSKTRQQISILGKFTPMESTLCVAGIYGQQWSKYVRNCFSFCLFLFFFFFFYLSPTVFDCRRNYIAGDWRAGSFTKDEAVSTQWLKPISHEPVMNSALSPRYYPPHQITAVHCLLW